MLQRFLRLLRTLAVVAALPAFGTSALAADGGATNTTSTADASKTDADKPVFNVMEYRVRGNTVLPAATIERSTYPELGPRKTIDDVEKARASLEEAYRAAGYATVFVDVPEQDVGSGVVLLRVTEGKVGRVQITGARYYDNGWIRDHVTELKPGSVPRLPEFQAELRELNARSPDRAVTPVLRPGAQPGTVDVELKVADELPVHGSLEVNNRNTANTTPERLYAALSFDNLWQRDHSLGIRYQVAPENPAETQVFAGSYAWRFENSDKTLLFYASDNKSNVPAQTGVSSIGKGQTYGTQLVWPLPISAGFYQDLQFGTAYKKFDNSVAFTGNTGSDIVTPISYMNWSVG